MKVGDEIVTKDPFWHTGENLGNKLGKIICTDSYILVRLYDYHSNPVKCFRNDVEVVDRELTAMDRWYDDDLDEWAFGD